MRFSPKETPRALIQVNMDYRAYPVCSGLTASRAIDGLATGTFAAGVPWPLRAGEPLHFGLVRRAPNVYPWPMTLKQLRIFVAVAEREHATRAAGLALSGMSGLKRGTLAVQFSQTISRSWLPARLAAFRRACPQIEVNASEPVAASALRAGTPKGADFGLADRMFHIVRHRECYHSKAGRAFLDLIAADGFGSDAGRAR